MYAVVDCETTGFDITKNEIVELAIVVVGSDFKPLSTFNTLIKPSIRVRQTEIHGIYNEDINDAPTFKQVATYVANLLDGNIIVAHGLNFDEEYLEKSFATAGLPFSYTTGIGICTKTIATRNSIKKPSLDNLAKLYNIKRVGLPHSALSDAFSTIEVAKKLNKSYPEQFEGHPFRIQHRGNPTPYDFAKKNSLAYPRPGSDQAHIAYYIQQFKNSMSKEEIQELAGVF